jgi:hypothetical protein
MPQLTSMLFTAMINSSEHWICNAQKLLDEKLLKLNNWNHLHHTTQLQTDYSPYYLHMHISITFMKKFITKVI